MLHLMVLTHSRGLQRIADHEELVELVCASTVCAVDKTVLEQRNYYLPLAAHLVCKHLIYPEN
ncbi:unnamed protein product, partial [Ceratitis capitata]